MMLTERVLCGVAYRSRHERRGGVRVGAGDLPKANQVSSVRCT